MQFVSRIRQFLSKPFFSDPRTLFGLWLLIGILSYVFKFKKVNNYMIFRGVFWHTWNETPLYAEYPAEYFDTNFYGPFFSIIVAPFALLPVWMGMLLWHVSLAMCLYFAIRRLNLLHKQYVFVIWICAHDLLSALFMSQFNVAIVAMIALAFYCIERGKDIWAALFIVIGMFVKLYGVVGLAFFFFSRNKKKFILSFIGWSVVCFVLPMLISSPAFICEQYGAWAESLSAKNSANLFSMAQNVSLLGIVRKVSGNPDYSDLWLIVPAMVLFMLPYLRFDQYKYEGFRYTFLASVLMFVVLFSTGSETSTYIIASVGVALWYITAPWTRGRTDLYLLIFAVILGSFGASDLIPKIVREEMVRPYALKVLPCSIIWLKLCYEQLTCDYRPRQIIVKE